MRKFLSNKFDELRSDFNKFLLRSNAWSETGIFLNTFITAILTAAILFLYSSSHSISQGRYLLIFVAFSAVSQQFTNLAKSIAALLASVPTYFSKNALEILTNSTIIKHPDSHSSLEVIPLTPLNSLT